MFYLIKITAALDNGDIVLGVFLDSIVRLLIIRI